MKKALIITYYWPPAGGPGVQRILNIVKHLPENGWQPIILTVKQPSAPAHDESLISQIPQNCIVYRTSTREPFTIYKKMTGKKSSEAIPKNITIDSTSISFTERLSRWIRANCFIPDARIGWKKHLIRKGLKIIKIEKPDIIFSTSPPHSLQLGAMALAQKSGIPWITDFRDPWTEAYWEMQMPKTIRSKNKNKQYEHKVLHVADHITTVGSGMKTLFCNKTPTPVSVVYNGFRDIVYNALPTEAYEIVHLGNLSAMQPLDELIQAIEILPSDVKNKIRLVFVGSVDPHHKNTLKLHPQIPVNYHDFMPYDKMLAIARRAAMFYIPRLQSNYSKGLITAKLFDYLALRRPILAFTESGSDMADILEQTQSGKAFTSNQQREAADYISYYVHKWETEGQTTLKNQSRTSSYSTQANVMLLVKQFDSLLLPK